MIDSNRVYLTVVSSCVDSISLGIFENEITKRSDNKVENWKKVLQEVKSNLEDERTVGVVRAVKNGYAFARAYPDNEQRKDYFFHAQDMDGNIFHEIEQGDIVSFQATDDKKGKRAREVKVELERHLIPFEKERLQC